MAMREKINSSPPRWEDDNYDEEDDTMNDEGMVPKLDYFQLKSHKNYGDIERNPLNPL